MNFFKITIFIICLAAMSGFYGQVRTGLDNIGSYQHIFQNQRVGIIANHTSCDSNGRFILDIFRQIPNVRITALFGPEHGFKGNRQDGQKVTNDVSDGNIPIYSLYGEHNQPTQEMLEKVDILVFDIQDIGCRYYTYISTMALAMEAAARDGKTFVVLDRPNPINAVIVGGNVLDPNFASFVGLYPIATRHGMTIGELAKMFNAQSRLKGSLKANLVVVPMTNYKRSYWYDQTGLKFIPPSPNMTSLESAAMYPGTCLFEGTNISEGRGTNKPFLLFGAPWVDSKQLTSELNNMRLPGIKFKETKFIPIISKYKNQKCFGSQIIIKDRDVIEPFWVGVAAVNTISQMYPDNFKWKEKHFDRLCGTDTVRLALAQHKSLEELRKKSKEEIKVFVEIRKKYLLY